MDPFAIYEELYISLREAVSGAMLNDDQIDALTEVRTPYQGYNNVIYTLVEFWFLRSFLFKIHSCSTTDFEIFRGTVFLTSIVRKGHPQQSVRQQN